MPIDPRELKPNANAPFELITSDRTCGRCGYSLKGLPSNGKCPECGKPIGGSKRGHRRFSDNLSDAPLYYLKALAWGTGLLAVCGLVSGLAFSRANRAPELWSVAIAGAAAVGWWVGVYIVTAKRATGENTLPDRTMDSSALRTINRVLHGSWVAAAAVLAVKLKVDVSVLNWINFGLQALGLVALIPLSLHLSALAYWANDTSLGERFKLLAWVMAVCGFFVLIGEVSLAAAATAVSTGGPSAMPAWFGSIAGLVLLVGVWSYLARGIAHLIFVFSLYQLAHEALWAVKNNQTASDVAVRLAQRDEEHARRIAERSAIGGMLQQRGPAPVLSPPKSTYGVNTLKPSTDGAYDLE